MACSNWWIVERRARVGVQRDSGTWRVNANEYTSTAPSRSLHVAHRWARVAPRRVGRAETYDDAPEAAGAPCGKGAGSDTVSGGDGKSGCRKGRPPRSIVSPC